MAFVLPAANCRPYVWHIIHASTATRQLVWAMGKYDAMHVIPSSACSDVRCRTTDFSCIYGLSLWHWIAMCTKSCRLPNEVTVSWMPPLPPLQQPKQQTPNTHSTHTNSYEKYQTKLFEKVRSKTFTLIPSQLIRSPVFSFSASVWFIVPLPTSLCGICLRMVVPFKQLKSSGHLMLPNSSQNDNLLPQCVRTNSRNDCISYQTMMKIIMRNVDEDEREVEEEWIKTPCFGNKKFRKFNIWYNTVWLVVAHCRIPIRKSLDLRARDNNNNNYVFNANYKRIMNS